MRMRRVRLCLLLDDAPEAALVLARCGVLDPETTDVSEDVFGDRPADRYHALHGQAVGRLAKLAAWLPHCVAQDIGEETPARAVELTELTAVNDALGALWHEVSALEEALRELRTERQSVVRLRQSLARFRHLDVDLTLLRRGGAFLAFRLGTVPRENLPQLTRAASLAGAVTQRFPADAEHDDVAVVGPLGGAADLDRLLASAGFRALAIPESFHDRPEAIGRELDRRRAELDETIERRQAEIEALCGSRRELLAAHSRRLAAAAPLAALAGELRATGTLAVLEGWIPAAEAPGLARALRDGLTRAFALDIREPTLAELDTVPSAMTHPRYLAGFAALVRTYGIPRYDEFDPTALFGISFLVMFGMMFGDVGQGLVLALAGLGLGGRWPLVRPFLVGAGMASMAFGFLYGSVFGYEHVLPALWIAPLSEPVLLLKVALWWGIGFILVANVLMIVNRLQAGRYTDALLDHHGAAGMLLYLGGIYAVARWMGSGRADASSLAAVLVPLAVIVVHRWRRHEAGMGERTIVAAVEGLESVIGYFANTLSFLRVAAFSLNHVALAAAVFALAETLDGAGHWTTILLGNVFIIVLEGAIVAIQVLRLEYYEGFSRFFAGDGREYRPLRLGKPLIDPAIR
jgi:V/A-type H+/Na+-transporting ATPase subunit I